MKKEFVAPAVAAAGISAVGSVLSGIFGGGGGGGPEFRDLTEEELALLRQQLEMAQFQQRYLEQMLPQQAVAEQYQLALQTGGIPPIDPIPQAQQYPYGTGGGVAGGGQLPVQDAVTAPAPLTQIPSTLLPELWQAMERGPSTYRTSPETRRAMGQDYRLGPEGFYERYSPEGEFVTPEDLQNLMTFEGGVPSFQRYAVNRPGVSTAFDPSPYFQATVPAGVPEPTLGDPDYPGFKPQQQLQQLQGAKPTAGQALPSAQQQLLQTQQQPLAPPSGGHRLSQERFRQQGMKPTAQPQVEPLGFGGGFPDWQQMLTEQGGLMGLVAQQEMAQYLAQIGLTPARTGLEQAQLQAETGLVPQRAGLESQQIGSAGRLLPFQETLARTGYETETGLIPQRGETEAAQLGMRRGLLGGAGFGALGTQYGQGIELEEALSRTGQYLQERGLFQAGLMPELGTRRAAEIAERTEGRRRQEEFGILQLGLT